MNAVEHAKISQKNRKGKIENYYNLHDFCDSSKEVDSTNRHRIYFHTLFGVKNFIIPIFGHTLVNSDGFKINVKDLCEQDHILPDYRGKFIPTLLDFVDEIEESKDDKQIISDFYADNQKFFIEYPNIKDLLMLPLWNTGKIKSLLLTHNSWFIGYVLPKIYKDIKIEIKDFSISPALMFERMRYQDWMSNGMTGIPNSYKKIEEKRRSKFNIKDVAPDGSHLRISENPNSEENRFIRGVKLD